MTMSRARKQHHGFFHFSWKKRIHFLLFLSLVSACVLFLNQFKNPTYFPIKNVKVYGGAHLNHEAMQHFLKPYVDRGFFNVNVEAIKDRLMQVAWVSDVSVQRVWPDQVNITVLEKNPIARWNHMSLLSEQGELFIPEEGIASLNLPDLIGPEGEQITVMNDYNQMNSLLKPLHFTITRLELTDDQTWNVTLSNGIKLTMGSKDILTHLTHFVKVYPKIIGSRADDVDYIDLRYSNGLAVKWKTVI